MSNEIRRSGATSKLAVQFLAALIVTLPSEQSASPLQPVKKELAPGVADSVTIAPLAKLNEHAVPQEMPAGALVTVPVPAPVLLTVSVGPPPLHQLPPSP